MTRSPSSWTSPVHEKLVIATLVDGWLTAGLVGAERKLADEVFGPIAPSEAATLAQSLVEAVLAGNPDPTIWADGAADRIEQLARASAALLALERAMRAVVPEDVAAGVDAALGTLRTLLSDLAAVER